MSTLDRKEAAAMERTVNMIPAEQKKPDPQNVLLVEDSEKNRLLIQTFLKKTPYHLDTAENGKIAVAKFTAAQYDLVLMDIEMPVMDGYEATAKIRKWEADNRVRATPIIYFTAHALKEHSPKSFETGCTGFLTKPIKMADLLTAIERYAVKGRTA